MVGPVFGKQGPFMINIFLAIAAVAAPQGAAGGAISRAQFVAQMDNQFGKMDANRDGQLSKAEIEQSQTEAAVAEAKARNRARFAELDTDKNGQLSPAEFAAATPPPPAANGQPTLTRGDRNRDNQISLAEHRIVTLANFDRLDTNRDGVVTPAEMKAGGIGR
jgi:hypothetical protein